MGEDSLSDKANFGICGVNCCILTGTVLTFLLFVVFTIVVICTVIPTLYQIDYNTDHIRHVEYDGTDHIPAVEEAVKQLHEDLLIMISQLDIAAALLTTMDANIDKLVNGS
eukprot:TRINITY_DN20630_c2_g1_i1.p1 TRINITY_DN20630_c2_g1~~TRINITY_DN20630_c2_g1_i1.p1  ORF type:complete len:127 (-),score=5.77 TRINITY_DN20630_c2_g1_i1:58-390(-)